MEIKQKYKYLIKGGRHADLKFVGETNDVVEADQIIHDYINEHIKKSYYQRINFDEMHIWIDYGSWTDFAFVYFASNDAKEKFYEYKLDLKD